MKKVNRSLGQAYEIARDKIYRFILAMNIVYAKRICSKAGCQFDAEVVEQSLVDSDDSVLYYEQQADLKRSFCVNSEIFRKFTKIRYAGGTRVNMQPIMAELASVLRVKSYNGSGKASYKVGEYSKMYVFNSDEIAKLCQEWHDSKGYSQKFDIKSEFYAGIFKEFSERFPLKFWDFNKREYRLDGSSDIEVNQPIEHCVQQYMI